MTSSPIPEGAHGSSAPSINRGPFGGQRYNATEADMRVMESLEALSLSSRGTGEEIIYQRQEQKRLSLESKMANVLRLNSQVDQELEAIGSDDREEDATLFNPKNVFGSTAPNLLSSDYNTRLAILDDLNENLEEQIRRKSRRLQGLKAERVQTSSLPGRDKSNLQ